MTKACSFETFAAASTVMALLAGCDGTEPSIQTAVLGLGAIPDRVASVSVAVFGPDGLVTSTTVAPPRSEFDLGVPAEVPLLFQVVARTATPAPLGFEGGMPAFVARTERTIPLTSTQVRVGMQARPAGGLVLTILGPSNLPRGSLVVRSDSGVPGVRLRVDPNRLPGLASFVLGRGVQQVTYELDESGSVPVLPGDGIWVAAETISLAEVRLAPPAPPAELSLRFLDADRMPVDPTESVGEGFLLELDQTVDGVSKPDPSLEVRFASSLTGTAVLSGLPTQVTGVPQRLPVAATGQGRVVVRAEAPALVAALAVINVGRPTAPVGLELALADRDRLAEGTELQIWTVDDLGRLTVPPAGVLNFSSSDPWLAFPDGDEVFVSAMTSDARIARPVALPSRPATASAVLRARLITDTGTLSANVALP